MGCRIFQTYVVTSYFRCHNLGLGSSLQFFLAAVSLFQDGLAHITANQRTGHLPEKNSSILGPRKYRRQGIKAPKQWNESPPRFLRATWQMSELTSPARKNESENWGRSENLCTMGVGSMSHHQAPPTPPLAPRGSLPTKKPGKSRTRSKKWVGGSTPVLNSYVWFKTGARNGQKVPKIYPVFKSHLVICG